MRVTENRRDCYLNTEQEAASPVPGEVPHVGTVGRRAVRVDMGTSADQVWQEKHEPTVWKV